jgi:hypothetical protein
LIPIQYPRTRAERSIQEVNEAKAVRRTEIEKRCLELTPSIPANLLSHMESFRAAIQISTPLTDAAWKQLMPRILAQHEGASLREAERVEEDRIYQLKVEEKRQQDAVLKEAKEIKEKEWDDAQIPVREALGSYADEVISTSWKSGTVVTSDNCPAFAADVLISVRRKYDEKLSQDNNFEALDRKETASFRPDLPTPGKLLLENMKWIFDTKIKPLTEQYRKELFLCNGCQLGPVKFYGFEGVIQHYAAKHTAALSKGTIVVHWRSQWPDIPPFNPDPSAAQSANHARFVHNRVQNHNQYPSYSTAPHINAINTADPRNGYQAPYPQRGTPQISPLYNAIQLQQYQGPHSMPNYNVPQDYYHYGPQNGDSSGAYSAGRAYQPAATVAAPLIGPQAHGGRPRYHDTYGSPVSYNPEQRRHFFSIGSRAEAHQTAAHPGGGTNGMYRMHLDGLANMVRETWLEVSGIKALPGSVSVVVILRDVSLRFQETFRAEPSLAMFIDGVTNHTAMKPMITLSGLHCAACSQQSEQYSTSQNTYACKTYALPTLFLHFQNAHVERAKPVVVPQHGIATPRFDWKEDMVLLPPESTIRSFLYSPGMDDSKLRLFATAFPGIFPRPPPSVGDIQNTDLYTLRKDDRKQLQTYRPATYPTRYEGDGTREYEGHHDVRHAYHEDNPHINPLDRPPTKQYRIAPQNSHEDDQGPFAYYRELSHQQYGRVHDDRGRIYVDDRLSTPLKWPRSSPSHLHHVASGIRGASPPSRDTYTVSQPSSTPERRSGPWNADDPALRRLRTKHRDDRASNPPSRDETSQMHHDAPLGAEAAERFLTENFPGSDSEERQRPNTVHERLKVPHVQELEGSHPNTESEGRNSAVLLHSDDSRRGRFYRTQQSTRESSISDYDHPPRSAVLRDGHPMRRRYSSDSYAKIKQEVAEGDSPASAGTYPLPDSTLRRPLRRTRSRSPPPSAGLRSEAYYQDSEAPGDLKYESAGYRRPPRSHEIPQPQSAPHSQHPRHREASYHTKDEDRYLGHAEYDFASKRGVLPVEAAYDGRKYVEPLDRRYDPRDSRLVRRYEYEEPPVGYRASSREARGHMKSMSFDKRL